MTGELWMHPVEEVRNRLIEHRPGQVVPLEHEDEDRQTRLTVLVHPRLRRIDEASVLDCVEEALGVSPSWVSARVYRRLETLQLRRDAPIPTRAGKVMPLHHLGPSAGLGTPPAQPGPP